MMPCICCIIFWVGLTLAQQLTAWANSLHLLHLNSSIEKVQIDSSAISLEQRVTASYLHRADQYKGKGA